MIDEYVDCHICGRPCKQVTSSHIRTHDLSIDEYRAKFGLKKADLISPALREKKRIVMLKIIKQRGIQYFKDMSEKGRLARDVYWNDPVNRARKGELQRDEMNRRFKDPEKLERQRKIMLSIKPAEFMASMSKECPYCGKRYSSKKRNSTDRFRKQLFCSKSCMGKYMHENKISFKDMGIMRERLGDKVNETVVSR